MKKYLEYHDDKSSKFYEVTIKDTLMTTRWGRIGSSGQSKENLFETKEEALREMEKLIAQKTRKGYSLLMDESAETKPLQADFGSKNETLNDHNLNNMGTQIHCSLKPDFIKTITTKQRNWKPNEFPKEFYAEFQSKKFQNLIKGIALPNEIKNILSRLDSLEKNNFEMYIDCPVNDALIFLILCHENSKNIKRIHFKSLEKFSLENTQKRFLPKIEIFYNEFKTNIPDSLFQLFGFYESFKSVCNDSILQKYPMLGIDVSFGGFENIDGIFKSVFSGRGSSQKDILCDRHGHHELSYFPVFIYGSDGVTHGFVFDLQLNEFTTCAYHGDGCYVGNDTIWDCFFKNLDYSCEDFDEIFLDTLDADEMDLFVKENLTLTYQELLEHFEELEYKDFLWKWFINFFLSEFLNYNDIHGIDLSPEHKTRYYYDFQENISEKFLLSQNKQYYVSKTYPRMVISIEKFFNPVFDYDEINRLLAIFDICGGKKYLKEFLESHPKIIDAIQRERSFDGQKVKKIAYQNLKEFYEIVVDFSLNENSHGRYGLSLLLGLMIWEQTDKKTSEYAVRLLVSLPDEVCHPLIKNLAREHGKTRFDKYIH